MKKCIRHRQSGMHNAKKVLYMGEPRIKFNQSETNPLSIVDKEPEFERWFFNNFIHITAGQNAHWSSFIFGKGLLDSCPWLEKWRLKREYIQENIIDFVKRSINNNTYIWLNIECVNIPIYEAIIKFHDVFIYGYDDEKKVFYAADFFRDGHYERDLIDYGQFAEGYANMENYKDTLGIYLISKKENVSYMNQYTNSNIVISKSLEKYLAGEFPFCEHEYMESKTLQGRKYGINIYQVIIDYCTRLIKGEDNYADYRIFDLLYRHKAIMYERINFISMGGPENIVCEKDGMKTIRNYAIVIRNMFLKYIMNNNSDILNSVIEKLTELEQIEREYYKKIITIMQS